MEPKLYKIKREIDTFISLVGVDALRKLEVATKEDLEIPSGNRLVDSIKEEYLYMMKKMNELSSLPSREASSSDFSKEDKGASKIEEVPEVVEEDKAVEGTISEEAVEILEEEIELPEEDIEEDKPCEEVEHTIAQEDLLYEEATVANIPCDGRVDAVAKSLIAKKNKGKVGDDPYFEAMEEVLLFALTELVLTEDKNLGEEEVEAKVISHLEDMKKGEKINFSEKYAVFENATESVKEETISGVLLGLKYDPEDNITLPELEKAFEKYPHRIRKKVNSMAVNELLNAADNNYNPYIKEAAKIKLLILDKRG